jgi:hypothetical protein
MGKTCSTCGNIINIIFWSETSKQQDVLETSERNYTVAWRNRRGKYGLDRGVIQGECDFEQYV